MTTIAIRNRAVKKALSKAFAPYPVRIRGSRGTGYGWLHVNIAYAPRDRCEWEELQSKANRLAAIAAKESGKELSRGFTDDTCQYMSNNIIISFEPCRSNEWRVYA